MRKDCVGEAPKIFRGPKRLLEPFEINRLEIVCDGACLGQCSRSVDVEHQLDVGTGFFTCRADRGDIDFMKLERAKSSIDRLAHAGPDKRGIGIADHACTAGQIGHTASQKPAQRYIGAFCRDIPKQALSARQKRNTV
jgi:hypothetical protein